MLILNVSTKIRDWLWAVATQAIVKVQSAVKGAVPPLTETLPYFELCNGKYRLNRENHGIPQCRDIRLNEERTSLIIPQAWSREIGGTIHWLYNHLGALAEAEYLGKKAPTSHEWMEIFGSMQWSAEEKAWALNIPMVEYSSDFNKLCEIPDYTNLWSFYSPRCNFVHCARLKRHNTSVYLDWVERERGMSLRFYSDQK